MKNLAKKLAVVSYLASVSMNASAQVTNSSNLDILPFAGPNMSDVVVDSSVTVTRSDNNTGTIDINVYCFGTNLRSVANPLDPNATIHAYLDYVNVAGETRTAHVQFSANAVKPTSVVNEAIASPKASVRNSANGVTTELVDAQVTAQKVRIRLKNTQTIGMDVLASGVDFGKLQDINARTLLFKSIRFEQELTPGAPTGQYMGKNGPLSASVNWVWAENGKKATVNAGFPGENQFCGGYFSPLVLTFDSDATPDADKSSNFVLNKRYQNGSKISWPSFNKHDMYFLAIDNNGNGIVDDGTELFGDNNGFSTGFANLAAYDLNGDGVIDEKDEIFKKLILWKDSNHDGVCKKKELRTLASMGVKSINLKYEVTRRELNGRGSLLGPGEFSFVDKKGVSKKGWVWDIFLANVPK
jgi:hypothetical protein